MLRKLTLFPDWAPWAVILAVSLACGTQAALRAWPEYELSASDPASRRQSPETLERIRRASALEMDGQPRAAEHELLIAAANDRRFLSAWALANFYHRQDDDKDFWHWAKRAVEMSHGDRTALYQLLLARRDAGEVRMLLPPALRPGFAIHLISAGRLEDAIAALADLDAQHAGVLAERLIANGRFEDALSVWNASRAEALRPDAPRIENAGFDRPPSSIGFDWRLGAGAVHSSGRLVVAAPGRAGEFASQYLVLAPGRRYRLRVEQESSGASVPLRWQIDDLAGRGNLLCDAPAVDAAASLQTFEFRTQPGTRFARLALAARDPVHGTYAVRRVRLDFAD